MKITTWWRWRRSSAPPPGSTSAHNSAGSGSLTQNNERAGSAPLRALAEGVRPIDMLDSVWIGLSWMEVRDLIKDGKRPSSSGPGGVEEQTHPPPASNYTLKTTLDVIARKRGKALVAPLVNNEPCNPDNPRINPGSICLTQETFRAVIATRHQPEEPGLQDIVMVADSGNPPGMIEVANGLNEVEGRPGPRYVACTEHLELRLPEADRNRADARRAVGDAVGHPRRLSLRGARGAARSADSRRATPQAKKFSIYGVEIGSVQRCGRTGASSPTIARRLRSTLKRRRLPLEAAAILLTSTFLVRLLLPDRLRTVSVTDDVGADGPMRQLACIGCDGPVPLPSWYAHSNASMRFCDDEPSTVHVRPGLVVVPLATWIGAHQKIRPRHRQRHVPVFGDIRVGHGDRLRRTEVVVGRGTRCCRCPAADSRSRSCRCVRGACSQPAARSSAARRRSPIGGAIRHPAANRKRRRADRAGGKR
jgi:hypothetical protein